jgi:hypothetical protein
VLMYEDSNRYRPPEEFYDFVRYKKNSRNRLINSNKDIFIIQGQNMFFSVLVILMYLSVWLFKLGDNSSNVVKIYIKI